MRLGRALGELSTENAELYKRVGQLEAELKTEKARHAAWSREMDRREEARAARDGAMAGRLKQLERALAERHDTADPGTLSGRLEKKESSAPEQIRQERRGGRFSNETIAVGVAVSAEVFTVAGDVLGAAPAEAGGLIAGAFGLIAAVIAWSRSRGKERHVHRPEDRGANP